MKNGIDLLRGSPRETRSLGSRLKPRSIASLDFCRTERTKKTVARARWVSNQAHNGRLHYGFELIGFDFVHNNSRGSIAPRVRCLLRASFVPRRTHGVRGEEKSDTANLSARNYNCRSFCTICIGVPAHFAEAARMRNLPGAPIIPRRTRRRGSATN